MMPGDGRIDQFAPMGFECTMRRDFILMPVSGVYYPISVLPDWLQIISWGLPTAYVFEGMRAILAEKTVHWDMLGIAFVLSAVYLVVGFQVFQWFFRLSRRAGTLLTQGE